MNIYVGVAKSGKAVDGQFARSPWFTNLSVKAEELRVIVGSIIRRFKSCFPRQFILDLRFWIRD